jgi:hypothetical protein
MKPWYEKVQYKKFVPVTNEDKWQRLWDKFQETLDRDSLDNSMGDHNYLISRYILEQTNYVFDENKFIETIKEYIKEVEDYD